MITQKIIARAEVSQAAHYYMDQKDDYYAKDSSASVWQGKGASKLGAVGNIDKQRFHAMLAGNFGKDVQAGSSIRKDSKARAAIDLTFSAPKSISLQALIGNDERLIKAHDEAVTYTLKHIEENFTRGRKKENGKSFTENTQNLIVAKFRHETARPTKDSLPDPQLHTHAVVMNLTKRSDGSWVSLSNEQIISQLKLHNAVYNAQLEKRVRELGYDVRFEKGSIELAHIDRKAIETFSKRSKEIEDQLTSRGKDRKSASHEELQTITLSTRRDKGEEISRSELHSNWVKQAKEAGIDFSKDAVKLSKDQHQNTKDYTNHPKNEIADKSINWAISHLTERESVMKKSDLLSYATRHSAGLVSMTDLENSLKKRIQQGSVISSQILYKNTNDIKTAPLSRENWAKEVAKIRNQPLSEDFITIDKAISQGRLVADEPSYTTLQALTLEKSILNMEKLGRDSVNPIIDKEDLQARLLETTLTPGQKEAINLMLTETNQIVGIQGLAGTGKSYALQSTQEILKEKGLKMVALAPYGSQVNSLRGDGIQAKTIASFLTATNKNRFTKDMDQNTVVVIDEAGVIPVRQMEKLLSHISKTGARIVTLGDTAQTKAVEAGRAFSLLQENGMKTAVMGDIQRQKNEKLKRAVEYAAVGKAKESLELIDKIATIKDSLVIDDSGHKNRDSSLRYLTIANEYTSLTTDDQAKTLIVTGTNNSRNKINQLIRQNLKLENKGKPFTLLTRHDTTRAQRSCAKYYNIGDIIQPERNYKNGLERGTLYKVIERSTKADCILVKPMNDPEAKAIEITTRTMTKLSVYQPINAELAIGDKVRITRNNAALDLVNGERATIVDIADKEITMDVKGKEVKLPSDIPLHLDYAYVTTAHSAQGLTCDRVFYNAESFSKTTAQDTYYVSISREKHEVVVFTDDAQKLPNAVNRVPYKGLAHDLVASKKLDKSKELQKNFEHEIG